MTTGNRRKHSPTPLRIAALGFGSFLGLSAPVPGHASNDSPKERSSELGFLSVTSVGAIPDDSIDDTVAIQKAIDQALGSRLVVLFPGGTYLISDTLRAAQPVRRSGAESQWVQDRREANALVGSRGGTRPTLKLSDSATGFDDPDRPKSLVRIWAQPRDSQNAGSTKPEHEQPNISFNQVFSGIDIDLRTNSNRGAIGIQHTGSQGSTLSDSTIWAEGAYAGVVNPPGQGGGTYNVHVIGGRYGIFADHQTRYPVMAGVTLTAQSGPALYWKGQSNLTVAGFRIERDVRASAPAILLDSRPRPFNAALTLTDGLIRLQGGRAIDNTGARSLYVGDVYVGGASEILKSGDDPPITPTGSGWTHVSQYGFAPDGADIVTDGTVRKGSARIAEIDPKLEEPAAEDLIGPHVWRDVPWFEDSDSRSVTDFGAIPNDDRDDHAAFSSALRRSQKVFVPKGVYDLSETLVLPADRHLFGAAKHLSTLRAGRLWRGTENTPIIATVDDPNASTSLSSILIENDSAQHLTLLDWRAGRHSVIRDVTGSQASFGRRAKLGKSPTYHIRGSGGGRWFGVAAEWNAMREGTREPGYRHLLIDAVKGPLALYGMNVERSFSTPQSEIRGSEDVRIYYLKGETVDGQRPGSTVMEIKDSKKIQLFGVSGNAKPIGNAFVTATNSTDIRVANVTPVSPSSEFAALTESSANQTIAISGTRVVSLFRRTATPD